MRLTKFSSALVLLLGSLLHAQPARRIAVISGNGPLERSVPAFALGENRLTVALTGKLAGKPGITLIAQTDIDMLLKTQNFQNSDRSSTETAARIGKLLGASQIVLVNFTNGIQSNHQDNTPVSTKDIATVQADANARLIDVETGEILTQPSSTFKQEAVASEIKRWPVLKNTGAGLQSTWNDLWTKATESISQDLAEKLTTTLAQAPAPAPTGGILVAGIVNGSVLINKGANAGIKNGDQLQIIRMVSTGVTDPATNQVMLQKQKVCVLTITDAEETNSSGTCAGGTPQRGDIAASRQP
ncbi:MAG TPA: CsgG/HfaB family protein [Terracidiphilus sp.]|jgi:hypothetical protein|nr:CsgG/HfaB family protein [Terracidiphilus sp.]